MKVADLLPFGNSQVPLQGGNQGPDFGVPFAEAVATGSLPFLLPAPTRLKRSTVVTVPLVVELDEWLVGALGFQPNHTRWVLLPELRSRLEQCILVELRSWENNGAPTWYTGTGYPKKRQLGRVGKKILILETLFARSLIDRRYELERTRVNTILPVSPWHLKLGLIIPTILQGRLGSQGMVTFPRLSWWRMLSLRLRYQDTYPPLRYLVLIFLPKLCLYYGPEIPKLYWRLIKTLRLRLSIIKRSMLSTDLLE
jgi:hypothetical protein